AAVHATGQPVLVGTHDVAESEELAARLAEKGVECAVLNAKNDEEEAAIIAEAGNIGHVTVSTQMAGRGTDIRLGGPDEARPDAAGLPWRAPIESPARPSNRRACTRRTTARTACSRPIAAAPRWMARSG